MKISHPVDSKRSKFGKEWRFHIPEHYLENVLTFLVTCSQQERRKLFPLLPLFLCHPTSTFPLTSFLRRTKSRREERVVEERVRVTEVSVFLHLGSRTKMYIKNNIAHRIFSFQQAHSRCLINAE